MTPPTDQKADMPETIWLGNERQDLRFAHDVTAEKYMGAATEYTRKDTAAPTTQEWIKAQPHETYEGLKKQFQSLKSMINSMGQQLSFYQKKAYETGEKHLLELQSSLESERAMNAKLTEELETCRAALMQGDAE